MLTLGLTGESAATVTPQNTAQAMGSGDLPVYATPSMIALMEHAAAGSVKACLAAGQTTVGTLMNVKHIAASPVGVGITAHSELIEIDRKRLVFTVKAFDCSGLIGEGTHERFIINSEPFIEKANAKRQGEKAE